MHDYLHKDLGLILEDMHDKNVLVNSETLFVIDTVFYTIDPAENEGIRNRTLEQKGSTIKLVLPLVDP